MKKLFLFLFLIAAFVTNAQEKQSLKDLLYSGKLKKDSSGVVRKTDDLSTKIDTTTKKEIVVEKTKPTTPIVETKQTITGTNTNGEITKVEDKDTASFEIVANIPATAAPTKTNTKLWKEYNDSLTKILKAEILSAKQIKKETYYMSFDYEIGTDGTVTVNTVSSTPSNAYLLAQVKQILDYNPPKLNATLDSNGQPRKVKRKQSFTITKD